MNPNPYINATKKWLETVIIGFQICPFAKHESDKGRIHFQVDENTDIECCLHNLVSECERLDNHPEIATSLLIYSEAFTNFDGYLDFLEIAEALMTDQGYEGTYQLASFHPDYNFEGAPQDDAANYTNRSPYPMLHLLREDDLETAISHYPDPENIPQRNILLTRELGLKKMQDLLAACY